MSRGPVVLHEACRPVAVDGYYRDIYHSGLSNYKVLILSTVNTALVGLPRLNSPSNKLPGGINLFYRFCSYREPGLPQIVVPRSLLEKHELGGAGVVSPTR